MNEIKSFTFYKEYFKAANVIKPISKRDKFLGQIFDFYYKDIEPVFEKDSDEESIWENISKPIKKLKTQALNGLKGGAPEGNQNARKTTQETTQITTQNTNQTTTTSNDVKCLMLNVNVFEYLESNYIRTISPKEYEVINYWLDVFNEEIIKHAIDISVMKNAKNLSYVEAILKDWQVRGYKKLEEILEAENSKNKKQETPNWLNKEYESKPITEEEQQELNELLKEFE